MANDNAEKKFNFLAAFHDSFANGPSIPSSPSYFGCFIDKISTHLRSQLTGLNSPGPESSIPVIFQINPGFFSQAERIRCRVGADAHTKVLRLVKGYGLSLTPSQIHLLVRSPNVQYVTLDSPIRTTSTLKGNRPRRTGPLPIGNRGFQAGEPIGVAVLDTGVSEEQLPAHMKIRLALDFVSEKPEKSRQANDNGTSHGTEIVQLIAEQAAQVSASKIEALALRVVDEDRVGSTSDLIRAIDWVIENREQFSIRMANLSLARQPLESHLQDPLCQAVRKMVESGIATTVSTGVPGPNDPWTIGSPGIEPSVITVADESFEAGTGDSAISTESRECWRGGFKPDIQVKTGAEGPSLAAAEVCGAIAGMLSANSTLSPTLVKSILMSTARHSDGSFWLNPKAAVNTSAEIARQPDWFVESEGPVWG